MARCFTVSSQVSFKHAYTSFQSQCVRLKDGSQIGNAAYNLCQGHRQLSITYIWSYAVLPGDHQATVPPGRSHWRDRRGSVQCRLIFDLRGVQTEAHQLSIINAFRLTCPACAEACAFDHTQHPRSGTTVPPGVSSCAALYNNGKVL